MDETTTLQLLEKAFKQEEWQYLQRHPGFQKLIKEHNGTHEDFEYLVEVGGLLLQQKEDLGLK